MNRPDTEKYLNAIINLIVDSLDTSINEDTDDNPLYDGGVDTIVSEPGRRTVKFYGANGTDYVIQVTPVGQ